MSTAPTTIGEAKIQSQTNSTVYRILFAISLVHLLNDSIQSVITANFPILRDSLSLNYTQLGFIGFSLTFTASLLQPVVGIYTDKKPSPYLLPLGMVSTFFGMLALTFASSYVYVLLSVVLVGIGSAVFHPEGSRVAHMAAGPRRGLAQSIYQVGGNGGQALAPLMTMLIFVPLGQRGALWFMPVAAAAILVQIYVARWYRAYLDVHHRSGKTSVTKPFSPERRKRIAAALVLLLFIVFARSWYGASLSNYFVFYIIDKFGTSVKDAQLFVFSFLAAGAVGTFFGGPIGDRFGRKKALIFSLLGSAPFALILPYANEFWTFVLLLLIGLILWSSFSTALVYAQELIPGKVGTISGLILGLGFGLGAIGAVAIGKLIDWYGITTVMKITAWLPLLGISAIFLPSQRTIKEWVK